MSTIPAAAEGMKRASASPRGGPMRRLGNISLLLAIAGFFGMLMLMHFDVLTSPWWMVLLVAFEAAAVGALADWYAVSALFHEVRVPICGWPIWPLTQHSNIIVRNRRRITDNLVELVQERWLTPEAIKAQVIKQSPSRWLIEHLRDARQLDRAVRTGSTVAAEVASHLDQSQLSGALDGFLRRRLEGIPVNRVAGLVRGVIERGQHQAVWESLLTTFERFAASEPVKSYIAMKLRWAANSYAREGWTKSFFKMLGEQVGGLDYEVAAEMLLKELGAGIRSARTDPTHVLRTTVDRSLFDFASRLEQGDEATCNAVSQVRQAIVQHADLASVTFPAVGLVLTSLREQRGPVHDALMAVARAALAKQAERLRSDAPLRERLDNWCAETVSDVLSTRRTVIGGAVRDNLEKLRDDQWCGEIEEKVGDDLQRIRLNGAGVGFCVGLVIGLLKVALLAS